MISGSGVGLAWRAGSVRPHAVLARRTGLGATPHRNHTSLLSALWTVFASRIELIEKTVVSAGQEIEREDASREIIWNEQATRVMAYPCLAVLSSVFALVVLVIGA